MLKKEDLFKAHVEWMRRKIAPCFFKMKVLLLIYLNNALQEKNILNVLPKKEVN